MVAHIGYCLLLPLWIMFPWVDIKHWLIKGIQFSCSCYLICLRFDLFQQAKLAEVQVSKKDLEDKLEALRTVKETAEQPEKEAKERHLKAWEGKLKIEGLSPFTICTEHHSIDNAVYLFS